jgi:hypothetical protein
LARQVIERTFSTKGSKFRIIDQAINQDGFRIVFLVRSSPIHPYGVCNYLFGLTSVTLKDYFLASFLGMMPATVMEVYFGTAMKNLAEIMSGELDASLLSRVFFWSGLAVTVFVTVFITVWLKKKLKMELNKYDRLNADETAADTADLVSSAHADEDESDVDLLDVVEQGDTSTVEMVTAAAAANALRASPPAATAEANGRKAAAAAANGEREPAIELPASANSVSNRHASPRIELSSNTPANEAHNAPTAVAVSRSLPHVPVLSPPSSYQSAAQPSQPRSSGTPPRASPAIAATNATNVDSRSSNQSSSSNFYPRSNPASVPLRDEEVLNPDDALALAMRAVVAAESTRSGAQKKGARDRDEREEPDRRSLLTRAAAAALDESDDEKTASTPHISPSPLLPLRAALGLTTRTAYESERDHEVIIGGLPPVAAISNRPGRANHLHRK